VETDIYFVNEVAFEDGILCSNHELPIAVQT
jgi:hypothetical protein